MKLKLKIKYKLYLTFSLILLFLIAVGVYSMFALNKVNEKSTEIADNFIPRIDIAHSMNTLQSDLRIYENQYVFATSNDNRENLEQLIKEKQEQFEIYCKELEKLIPEDRRVNFEGIIAKWNQYLEKNQEVMNLVKQDKVEEAQLLLRGDSLALYKDLSEDLLDSIKNATNETNIASTEGDQIFVSSIKIEGILILIAILFSVVVAVLLSRNINGSFKKLTAVTQKIATGDLSNTVNINSNDEFADLGKTNNEMIHNLKRLIMSIQDTSEQVAASSQELTASSEQSAIVTNEIANSITQIVDASLCQLEEVTDATEVIRQISVSIEAVSANAHASSEQANSASNTAQEGSEAVKQALLQMKHIEDTVNDASKAVMTLGDSSKEIGQIVGVISDIASQTNLLALNAAIEAARAGDSGKGFAVVAEEVRKLAEQSQEATEKIDELIKTIQTDTKKAIESMQEGKVVVKQGADMVNTSGTAFLSIVELIQNMSEKSNEITREIKEVANRTQQVVASVDEIDRTSKNVAGETQNISAATEEQSASVQQIAESSKSLAILAQTLDEEAKKFTL